MRTANVGPAVARALRVEVEGSKRRKVFLAIAAFADRGRSDPSIAELATLVQLPRFVVVLLVDDLDRRGLLGVRRRLGERNIYTVAPEVTP